MKKLYNVTNSKQYERDVKLAKRRGLYHIGTHVDIFGKGKKR